MNPLAALKEKLMIKPNVEERERVAVVIKGVKKGRKPRAPKIKAAKVEEAEKEKYPIKNKPGEFYEWRMDMTTLQMFPERDFMEALSYIGAIPE